MPDLPGQAEIDDHPDPGNGDEAVDLNERLEERLDEPARIEREAAVQAGDRIMQLFAGREDDPAVLHRQLPREGVLVQNFIMNVNQADPAQARQI